MIRILKMLSAKSKVMCAALALMSVFGAYLVSLIPVYLGRVLDGISDYAPDALSLILNFAAVFFASEALNIFRRVSADRVSARFEEDLRNNSIMKLLKLPMRELAVNGISGELTSKINQAVSGAVQLMKMLPNDLLPAVFVGIFVVVQCFRQAPAAVALIILGYIVCTLTASLLQIKNQRGIRVDIIRKKTKLDGKICQAISGIDQIRSLGAEDDESGRLALQTKDIRFTEANHHAVMGMFDLSKHLIKTVFFSALLVFGVTLIGNGEMTAGNVLAVVLLFQQLLKPIDEFYRFIDVLSASTVKAEMLDGIMNTPSDEVFAITDKDGAVITNEISIKNYEVLSPTGERIPSKSKDISFPANGCTALTAPSGAGKSSFIKAMMRNYRFNGPVTMFGLNLSEISQRKLTKLIHYVPQAPFFFAASVRENLCYGLEKKPDDDEMTAAMEKACLLKEVSLDRVLQENGRNLSGGQLKRLAIARALLRIPKLYIFDETFANIDAATAEKLLTNIENHAKSIGAGIVHISHDSNIVKRCSQTVTLESAELTA